jgi:hypothetical protein
MLVNLERIALIANTRVADAGCFRPCGVKDDNEGVGESANLSSERRTLVRGTVSTAARI